MTMNQEFARAVELVNKSENILVTTHTKPDGDACGAVAALVRALTKAGKNIKPLFLSGVPDWYMFLFDSPPAVLGENISLNELKESKFIDPDLIIIVDTNSNNQLAGFSEYLKANNKPVLVMDHHVTNDGLGNIEIKDTAAAAAGQIVFDFLRYNRYEIDNEIARALFVAIVTDTGWFRFSNVDSRVLSDCSELVKLGAEPAKIYHDLYQCFSIERFNLMTVMFNTLELHFEGRYATQYLNQQDFKNTGADYKDTENLIDECQKIGSVEAVALFVEQADGRIKCSLRSRGGIDVRNIAQKFGGGGHIMASGMHLDGPLESAMNVIFKEFEACF